jgi:hypothetical protein
LKPKRFRGVSETIPVRIGTWAGRRPPIDQHHDVREAGHHFT